MSGRKGARTTRESFNAYSGTQDLPEDFASMGGARAPRGRAREQAPVASQGRRRGRLLLLIAVLGVGVLAAVQQYGRQAGDWVARQVELPHIRWPNDWLPDEPLLDRPFRSARIDTPLSRLREDEIRSVLAHYLDQGFFSLDVEGLKAELQAHPWVDQASVRRQWPDGLVVSVQEHRPIARWDDDSLINLEGEIFGQGDLRDAIGLPRLRGPDGDSETVMRQYQQFSQLLQPAGLRIEALTLGDRGDWTIGLSGGLQVAVGREQLTERVQRFVTLYRQELAVESGRLAFIDLRYRNGLAVRFRDQPTGAVAAVNQNAG